MQLFPIGQSVKLDENITGVITAILIHSNTYVEYQVVWWDGNTRNCQYVSDIEIKPDNQNYKSLNIGFKG